MGVAVRAFLKSQAWNGVTPPITKDDAKNAGFSKRDWLEGRQNLWECRAIEERVTQHGIIFTLAEESDWGYRLDGKLHEKKPLLPAVSNLLAYRRAGDPEAPEAPEEP
jgi:hypothetical protein